MKSQSIRDLGAYRTRKLRKSTSRSWIGLRKKSFVKYAAPIVLVAKKDGTKRLCCDYRKLNQKIIRDGLDRRCCTYASEGEVFTTVDLSNGFVHVPVQESSRKYTAFVTQSAQYEICFVPFGIFNSPAVFMPYIFAVLRPFIEDRYPCPVHG